MRASRRSRLLAVSLDLLAGLLTGILLAPGPLGRFFSARAVVLLRIGEPGTWFVGPVAMIIGIFGELVFLLPLVWMMILAPEALWGAAVGKLVTRLRIRSGVREAVRARLTTRYLIKTLPAGLTVVALLTGIWAIQVMAVVAAAALAGDWILAAGRGVDVAYDRVAGTVVSRRQVRGAVRPGPSGGRRRSPIP